MSKKFGEFWEKFGQFHLNINAAFNPGVYSNKNKIFSLSLSVCYYQSWARAFFYASRLRALGQSSSRWRFRALFWALNFALLSSCFRAHALLDFSRSFFALLDFSCSYICAFYFRARNFMLVLLYMARTGQPGQDSQNRTPRTGQPEQDRRNRTG
jgi:hypothetical protein